MESKDKGPLALFREQIRLVNALAEATEKKKPEAEAAGLKVQLDDCQTRFRAAKPTAAEQKELDALQPDLDAATQRLTRAKVAGL